MSDREGGQRMSLRGRLFLLLGISALVLVIASVILFTSLATLSTQRGRVVNELDPAVIASRDLRAAMIDQETGVRGFVITRNPSFLQPWDRGLANELAAKSVLEPIAAGDPEMLDDFHAVTGAADAWQTQFGQKAVDATIADLEDPEFDPAKNQDTGQRLFDDVRSSIDRLESNLNATRDASVAELNTAGQRVWTVAICALLGIVAVGIVIAVALKRTITDPILDLAEDVRGIADGDLEGTVEVDGIPELERLAADIDAMRLQILGELARLNRAKAEIEQQSIELQRSNADLEQFAYVASHDLQEPLRKIAGFCQLLERRYRGQLDERADEYIDFVVDGAKRMQELINDLLAFSRVGRTTDRFLDVDLDEVAGEVVDTLRGAIDESGGAVVVDPLPVVRGDRRLLTALFQNLVGNALKFRGTDPPLVHVSSETDQGTGFFRLLVADNGIGIDDEYAEQIFTIFQRLHSRSDYDGTGIGLALAKRIVEFHGGAIWLDTAVDSGSTFRFTLPIPRAEREPTDEDPLGLDELVDAALADPAPMVRTPRAVQETMS